MIHQYSTKNLRFDFFRIAVLWASLCFIPQVSFSINYYLEVGKSITIDPPSAASGTGFIDQVHILQTSSALSITKNSDCSVKITANSYFENTVTVILRFVEKYTLAGHIGKVDHDVSVNITCKYIKPTSISLPDITIAVGSGADIIPTIQPRDATITQSVWSKTGNAFNGSAREGHFYHVYGRSVGTGTVTVVLNDNDQLTASCKVTVVDPDNMPPTNVFLPESKTISVGGSVRLTPELLPENSSTTFRWSSDNESVATVDYGKVTGKKVGTARITVKTANGLTASCQVTVSSTGPFDDESDGTYTGSVDGYEYVDLGLSVKWATCNVGASNPEDYGGFYAWGETSEKSSYKWENYAYGTYLYAEDIGSDIKGTNYDVSHVKWGDKWRMPTEKEFRELYSNCTVKSTTRNSVEGFEFIGNNGQSIFFPSAGHESTTGHDDTFRYWTSNLSPTDPGKASSLQITMNRYKEITATVMTQMRLMGMPIRPVTEAEGLSTKEKIWLSANPSGGEVKKGTTVTLSADVYGADIYYTLDGSTPTKNSNYYYSGITINSDCTLKAIAYKEGYYSSDVLTEYYSIEQTVVTPTDISVSPSSKTINVGDSFTMSYTLTPSNAETTVTWSSDDSSIASVSSSGVVTGKKVGTTYINATTSNGKTAWCKVVVEANDVQTVRITSINSKLGTNFIVMSDGSLWGFGHNFKGELGDGTNERRYAPIKIMDGVLSASAGYEYSLFLKLDGSLWACGHNYYSLGDGITTDSYYPIKIMDNVSTMSAGRSHSLIVKDDGTLWSWGSNGYGQLGDGTWSLDNSKYSPIKIMEGVQTASAGDDFSLILKKNGELWGCGNIIDGALGNATDQWQDALYPVKMMDRVESISAGERYSLIVKNDGSLWGCGFSIYGEIGEGTVDGKVLSPVKIMDDVMYASAGRYHSLIVKNDGSLWGCGYNEYGELGNGTKTNSAWPVKIMDGVANAVAGHFNSLILKSDGTLWGCGDGVGDGTNWGERVIPVLIMNGATNIDNNNLKILPDADKDAPIYDLQGQRLENPRKGINIIGGKKVVVK